MKSREDRIQEAHNQGQRDGANKEYHAPNGVLATDWDIAPKEELDTRRAENEAYAEGNEHAYKQIPWWER